MDYQFEAQKVRTSLSNGIRLSGRGLNDYRNIKIEYDVAKNADGSAIVTLGKTKVIAGVKAIIDVPFPDSPDEGSITVGVELSPMADPTFEAGPPNDFSIEVSRVVDRGIRESKAIDFSALSIKSGEKAWFLYLDVYIINNDGNLFDACSIASLAALTTTKIPDLDSNHQVKDSEGKALKLNFKPIYFTFAKIGNNIILDPDLYEDAASDARFSVSITDKGNLCAIQKGQGGSFSLEELSSMVSLAKKKYKEVAINFK